MAMASIVLADDDEDLRAVYARCLRSAGHAVWSRPRAGIEALELVREHRPEAPDPRRLDARSSTGSRSSRPSGTTRPRAA